MTAGVFGERTKDGKNIVLMVSGSDHEINKAAQALKHMTPLMRKSDPPGALICPATWAAVTQLAFTFNGSETTGKWMPGDRLRAWILEEFSWRTRPTVMKPPLTGNGAKWPRPYQIDGAQQIGSTDCGFLLFDDPGVGKSCTTILGLKIRLLLGIELWPMIIICPSWEVNDVWAREIGLWAPEWQEPVTYGGPKRAEKAGAKILLTTYATAMLDGEGPKSPLVKLKAKTVVADEAHYLRNIQAKRTGAVQRIAAKAGTFVALTGTPVTRDTGDIFPIMAAMDPQSYPSRERFVKRYLQTSDSEYGEKIEGLAQLAEPEFRTVLQGQYRRAAKADVLSQLPPKVYSIRRVELPAEWRRAYDGIEQEMLAELPDGGELPVMSTLAQITRMGQLASSAFDVAVTVEVNELGLEVKHYEVTLKAPSWKADALLGILAERPGQPVAVFANSRQLIDITGAQCEKAGYRCGYITGGQGKVSRHDDIDSFQDGKLDVILCTAGAGGLGITLTAAGTVVMLQRSWSLDLSLQPEDRAHRMGNEHEFVEIIDIVARDTVDSRVRTLMREKGHQLGQLVRDPRLVRELLGGLK